MLPFPSRNPNVHFSRPRKACCVVLAYSYNATKLPPNFKSLIALVKPHQVAKTTHYSVAIFLAKGEVIGDQVGGTKGPVQDSTTSRKGNVVAVFLR